MVEALVNHEWYRLDFAETVRLMQADVNFPHTRAIKKRPPEGGLFIGRRQPGQSGLNLNLAPPSAASYISPPLMIEKEAMPFS